MCVYLDGPQRPESLPGTILGVSVGGGGKVDEIHIESINFEDSRLLSTGWVSLPQSAEGLGRAEPDPLRKRRLQHTDLDMKWNVNAFGVSSCQICQLVPQN